MAGTKRPTSAKRLAVAIYKQVYRQGSASPDAAVRALGLTPDEADAGISELARLGLISRSSGGLVAPLPPETAIAQVLKRERTLLSEYRLGMAETRDVLDRIVEQFLPISPEARRIVDFKIIPDPRAVVSFLDSMIRAARRELMSLHPGPLRSERPLVEALSLGHQLAERDLRLRAVYSQRLASAPRVLAYLDDLMERGCELRAAPSVPIRMVISDGQRAVVPLDPRSSHAGAVVIEGELFVRALVSIFEHCWQDSLRFEASPEREPPDLTEQERSVLEMLAVGTKDAKIARNLGVSLRTVSRIVNGLMHRLSADSRFQAGVRAKQIGWVD
jgi:DNA-binding CsgD family transcriptional regulator